MQTKEKPCACGIDRRVRVSVKVLNVLVEEGGVVDLLAQKLLNDMTLD